MIRRRRLILRQSVAATFAWLAVLLVPAIAAASPSCRAAPGGGLTLANVAAANGVVRAVGSNGLIVSASSLTRWHVERTPIVHNLRGIAWTGTRWVAVGDVGSILYLQRGRWISVPGLPNTGLRGIAAGDGLVAASGSDGVLLISHDGVSWTVADSGTAGLLWGGARVGSTLLLSGQNSLVIASDDGVTWDPVPTSPLPTGSLIAPRPLLWQLAASGAKVVAVGDFGAILEGTIAGGLRGQRSPTDEILRGVSVARGRWVAVGSGGTVLFSRDGRNWRSERSPTSVDLRGVAWTGHRFVAVGDQSTVISSRDGRHWHLDESAMPCALLGVARGSGRFVAVGGSGDVQISRDGRAWRRVRTPNRQDLYAIARGPHGFVAVGARGTVLVSRSGISWTSRSVPTRLNLHAVFWTGSRYLAGGDRGELLGSRDGSRWRHVSFPGFHSIRAFATDGRSVIAAGAGTIARRASPTAGWQLQSIGLGRFQTGVAYGRGRFVIVGHNGELLVSTDGGQAWTPSASGVTQNLDAVVWTGSRFLAAGEGVTVASTNGLSWQRVNASPRHSLRALAPWRRSVAAVGDEGTHLLLAG